MFRISGRPGSAEIGLATDVGLYLNFDVTNDVNQSLTGLPAGCPGGFNFAKDAKCPVNKLEEPHGTTPLYQMVEEYAHDQNRWMEDFVPTMEKMMSNGYNNDDLIDSGYDYASIKCYGRSRFRTTNCIYKSEGDGDVR